MKVYTITSITSTIDDKKVLLTEYQIQPNIVIEQISFMTTRIFAWRDDDVT